MTDRYKAGDWWVLDDQTGQKVRASETQEQWDGKIVHKNNFEPRHPQNRVGTSWHRMKTLGIIGGKMKSKQEKPK